MATVAILGAGPLGGTIAFTLALGDRCSTVLLIDDADDVAKGKALDISQACPIAHVDTRVWSSPHVEAAAGADIVIVADRARDEQEWQGEPAVAALSRALDVGRRAIVMFAGPSQTWVLERSVLELGCAPARVLGTAVLALEGGVRAVTALEADRPARDVILHVMGRPPEHAHIPWETALIAGLPAVQRVDAAATRRIEGRLPSLWPPAPYALAAAATAATSALLSGADRTLTCVAMREGLSGAIALPARLGPEGIRELLPPAAGRARMAVGL
jgi:malate dehydrogenase